MKAKRGDVVRSSDPFKLGERRQRPWLIIHNDSHPFGDEQFLAVAITTKEYDRSLALETDVWEVGGVPRESFVSPWAVHSPRAEDLVAWQGQVTSEFVDTVVDEIETYLR
jgi:mRNA-degrading endonuclease toxin of MazEF toxin-antitoxin module